MITTINNILITNILIIIINFIIIFIIINRIINIMSDKVSIIYLEQKKKNHYNKSESTPILVYNVNTKIKYTYYNI